MKYPLFIFALLFLILSGTSEAQNQPPKDTMAHWIENCSRERKLSDQDCAALRKAALSVAIDQSDKACADSYKSFFDDYLKDGSEFRKACKANNSAGDVVACLDAGRKCESCILRTQHEGDYDSECSDIDIEEDESIFTRFGNAYIQQRSGQTGRLEKDERDLMRARDLFRGCPIFAVASMNEIKDDVKKLQDEIEDLEEREKNLEERNQKVKAEFDRASEELSGKLDLEETQKILKLGQKANERAISEMQQIDQKISDIHTNMETLDLALHEEKLKIHSECHGRALAAVHKRKEDRRKLIEINQLQGKGFNSSVAQTNTEETLVALAESTKRRCFGDAMIVKREELAHRTRNIKMKQLENIEKSLYEMRTQALNKITNPQSNGELQEKIDEVRQEYSEKRKDAQERYKKYLGQLQLIEREANSLKTSKVVKSSELSSLSEQHKIAKEAAGSSRGSKDIDPRAMMGLASSFEAARSSSWAICGCETVLKGDAVTEVSDTVKKHCESLSKYDRDRSSTGGSPAGRTQRVGQ